MSKFEEKLKFHEKTILSEMAYGYSAAATSVTQAELIEKIKAIVDKDVEIKMTSITDATYVKSPKRNTLGTVYKVSQTGGLLNSDYAARKQEKLDQTAPGTTYTPGKTYGTHVTGSVVEHNGKWYIQVLPQAPFEKPRFVVKNNIGQFKEEPKATVEPVLAPAKPGGAGADEVVIRRYGIGSIVALEVNNQSFVVSDVDADRKAVLDIVNSTQAL